MLTRGQFIKGCAALGAAVAAGIRSAWPETPVAERLRARLRDGSIIEYRELRAGDEFLPIDVYGVSVDPFTFADSGAWCRCSADAVRAPGKSFGYAVALEII